MNMFIFVLEVYHNIYYYSNNTIYINEPSFQEFIKELEEDNLNYNFVINHCICEWVHNFNYDIYFEREKNINKLIKYMVNKLEFATKKKKKIKVKTYNLVK